MNELLAPAALAFGLASPAHAVATFTDGGGETIALSTVLDSVVTGAVLVSCMDVFPDFSVACGGLSTSPFDVVVPDGFLLDRVAVTRFERISGDGFGGETLAFTADFTAASFSVTPAGAFPVEVDQRMSDGPGTFRISARLNTISLISKNVGGEPEFDLTFALTAAQPPASTDVPLPAAAPLLLAGLGGLAALRRRRGATRPAA